MIHDFIQWIQFFLKWFKPKEYEIAYVENDLILEKQRFLYYSWFPFLSWKKSNEDGTHIPVVEIQEEKKEEEKIMFTKDDYQI